MGRGKTIALWILQILLAALFLLSALPKLTGNPGIIGRFRDWGYPDNFYLLVGGVELLGAVALLSPRVAAYGASALVIIMIGASFTHLLHAEYPRVFFTGTLLVFLVLLALARRPTFLRRR